MEAATTKHILGDFDDGLRSMRDTVLMMASLPESVVAKANAALSTID